METQDSITIFVYIPCIDEDLTVVRYNDIRQLEKKLYGSPLAAQINVV